jgi:hypothetical protein
MLESILFLAGLVVVACCVLGGLFFCFGTRRTAAGQLEIALNASLA